MDNPQFPGKISSKFPWSICQGEGEMIKIVAVYGDGKKEDKI